MKILFTVEFYNPNTGGAQEVVKQLAERLVKVGHDVWVATTFLPQRKGMKEINGVKIKEFKISGNLVRGINGDKKEIGRYQEFLKNDFNILVNYAAQIWTTDLLFDVLDKIKSKKILIPCGYSGLKVPSYKNYFDKLPEYLKKYDKLIYMSPDYQDKKFGDETGVRDKAVIVPNGAAEDEFLTADNFNIRQRLGIKTPYLIIDVSNHYRDKGHRFVIEAFKKMERKDATLLIVGNVPSAGAKKFAHILRGCYKTCYLNSLLDKNIRIVNGKNRQLVLSAYKSASLFLFGSQIECAPLVMYESFASKTPFITTEVGNVKDHKEYLKIVKTPKEMALVANKLLDNDAARKELANKAFLLWENGHTWNKITDLYEKLFKELVYGE